ncbi:gamma-aminobutyric acid receptor subunit rho-2-like isoform X2 [Sebastes umbrosus]|uniref:gamma-aminobutyric acid receptor subunit rho-2-like isoform X2 n=1 Tax=Sebastes umbrosus TaxID=72105 RepID=UPI0018A079D3|nr:gamma-aminobutyric acid receptor subunit rho-2-like isoform X2 [Sebastes umbrosus]
MRSGSPQSSQSTLSLTGRWYRARSVLLHANRKRQSSTRCGTFKLIMPGYARFLLVLVCLILLGECRKHRSRKKRWSAPAETHKPGSPLSKKVADGTKSRKVKTSHLLRIDDHDFTMRPAFAGPAVPVGVDVQVESLDSISEVDMDFTMTLYLRHYWKDERLAFPSSTNKSMTFDGRLVKKIWVPDVFFVHSKRSFIHDTTTDNIMLRVFPDGHVLYSLRVTVTAACNMDFSRFPLDSQTCTLELESYAYTDEDLMLYWKSGDESLSTDDRISLSQFLIQKFHTTSRLAFYSSTGITTVLTMSTIITGVNASMPRVSYIKAVDIYLWVSFVFVFLSVLEYAAVNYLTTLRDGKDRKLREKARQQSQTLPCTCGMSHTRTMMLDGTYSEADANSLAGYTRASMAAEDASEKQERMVVHLSLDNEPTGTKKKRGFRIIQNTHAIDTYSRMIFPGSYILFNLIYWCVYC